MAHRLIFGCGYLGRVAARAWIESGDRVSALTRSNGDELRSLGIEPIIGDVTAMDSLQLPRADTVLYAIGLDRRGGKSMREVYVGGLENILERLPAPSKFVYVSSTSVYGQASGEWVDESAETQPVEENGKIVLESEQSLRRTLPDAIILRFAGIYGPKRMIRRAAIEKGEPIAIDPAKVINLIHVDDGARAVIVAAQMGMHGDTINVADGCPVTRGDFYREMATILGCPPPRFEFTSDRGAHRRIDNAKMRTELGVELQFPDFRAGLRDALAREAIR